ncbi:MAG: hypothetical protein GY782_06790 [Gammaproteobacteria bacterium]|nr:hypothetical protein [Gammaproteobacteria bacterium]
MTALTIHQVEETLEEKAISRLKTLRQIMKYSSRGMAKDYWYKIHNLVSTVINQKTAQSEKIRYEYFLYIHDELGL